jgi:hypothetical protein
MNPTGRLFNLTPRERHMRQVGATQRGMILVAAHALAGGDLPATGEDRDAFWAAAAEVTLPRRRALIEDAKRMEAEALDRAEAKRRRKAEHRLRASGQKPYADGKHDDSRWLQREMDAAAERAP